MGMANDAILALTPRTNQNQISWRNNHLPNHEIWSRFKWVNAGIATAENPMLMAGEMFEKFDNTAKVTWKMCCHYFEYFK